MAMFGLDSSHVVAVLELRRLGWLWYEILQAQIINAVFNFLCGCS